MRKVCAGRVAVGNRSSWAASRNLPQHEAPGVLSPPPPTGPLSMRPVPWGVIHTLHKC